LVSSEETGRNAVTFVTTRLLLVAMVSRTSHQNLPVSDMDIHCTSHR
jgi:hypothetical protein